jgi:hypothetical protein
MKREMIKRDEMKRAMKNTHEATKNTCPINGASIKILMKQQANNFFVERDDTGELVFHWIDTRVEMLASRKLWDILGSMETPNSDLDQAFIDAIIDELVSRSDFFDSKPMPMSH